MRRVIDTIEGIAEVDTPRGHCEVCAAATASYDEASAKLFVNLEAFLRTTDIRIKEKRLSAEWLPKAERVCESAGPEETGDMARDIFQRWVRKVREAIPAHQAH